MRIFTIGFTKSSAEHFFGRLKKAGVKKILDVRLNNVSQLAGFAKRDDLAYFAHTIGGIGYEHVAALAPTQDILDSFRKERGAWADTERRFLALMEKRRIEEMAPETLDGGCLLCSEDKPHHCHRRLVAEYLAKKWGNVDIVHL